MRINNALKSLITISGLTLALLSFGNAHSHAAELINQNLSNNTENVQTVQNTQTKNLAVVNKVKNAHHHSNNRTQKFNKIYKVAHSKLGDRYQWGATGPHRFDCAGFTQYVYKHGIHKHIPRTADAQQRYSKRVSYKNARPGDLAFFGYGRASHVGLYLGHDKMIDAQLRGVIIEHVHAPWWHILGFGRILK